MGSLRFERRASRLSAERLLLLYGDSCLSWAYEKVLVSMIHRKPLQKIVYTLIEKQRLSSSDLAKELDISDKAFYQHIAELHKNDIIEKFPGNGRNVVYSIMDERIVLTIAANPKDRKNRNEYFAWLLTNAEKFQKVFPKYSRN